MVTGSACGFRLDGTGFAAAPDTVLTNAHVVAGVSAPEVLSPDGRRMAAQVVVFDPRRDVAVLAVPNLDERPLTFGTDAADSAATIYGHPYGQEPVRMSTVRVVGRETADVPDIYNTAPTRQSLVGLSGDVRAGDSGAPVVDSGGSVVGMVFAMDLSRPQVGYAIPSDDLQRQLSAPRDAAGDSGPCLAAA
jgi:S1-C subfamily serine protease